MTREYRRQRALKFASHYNTLRKYANPFIEGLPNVRDFVHSSGIGRFGDAAASIADAYGSGGAISADMLDEGVSSAGSLVKNTYTKMKSRMGKAK